MIGMVRALSTGTSWVDSKRVPLLILKHREAVYPTTLRKSRGSSQYSVASSQGQTKEKQTKRGRGVEGAEGQKEGGGERG
jgi:hypothetical protein